MSQAVGRGTLGRGGRGGRRGSPGNGFIHCRDGQEGTRSSSGTGTPAGALGEPTAKGSREGQVLGDAEGCNAARRSLGSSCSQ